MKKLTFILLILSVLLLTSCNNTRDDDSINCNVNQVEENGECIDIVDDNLCDDDQEFINDECRDIEITPASTPEELFQGFIDTAISYFDSQKTLEYNTELHVYTTEENVGVTTNSTTKYNTIYDENRLYYYERIDNVSDDYTDDEFAVQTVDNIIIDVEENVLHVYDIHNRLMSLDYFEEGGDFIAYVESFGGVNSLDLDMDYCDALTEISPNVFECMKTLRDFTDDLGLLTSFIAMGFEDLLNSDIVFIITFDDYGYKTTVELNPITITYTINETIYELNLEFTQEIIIGNHGEVYHPFFGIWVYILPDTKEGIIFESPMYYQIQNNEYYVNDIGWAVFDLEAGFYSFAVNGSPDSYTYQVFDEQGNELEFNYRVELTAAQTIYIKIDSDEPQSFHMYFDPIDLIDIVIEYDYPILGGTITGYNEGMDDFNGYHIDQTAPFDGILTLDVTNIDFDDFFTISYGNGFGCWANDVDYCHIEIKQGEEIYFVIFAEYVGDYEFSYSFNEITEYPTDISTMRNIDEFDGSNPIYLGEDLDEVSVKFVVTEANKTFHLEMIVEGSAKNIYTVDLYDSEGNLLIASWYGYDDLDEGIYVIKFTKSSGTLIVIPNIMVYDRP